MASPLPLVRRLICLPVGGFLAIENARPFEQNESLFLKPISLNRETSRASTAFTNASFGELQESFGELRRIVNSRAHLLTLSLTVANPALVIRCYTRS
jgi:hypothetical protein